MRHPRGSIECSGLYTQRLPASVADSRIAGCIERSFYRQEIIAEGLPPDEEVRLVHIELIVTLTQVWHERDRHPADVHMIILIASKDDHRPVPQRQWER